MKRSLRIYGYSLLSFFVTFMALSYYGILITFLVPFFTYITVKNNREALITLAIYSMLIVISYRVPVAIMYIFSYAGLGVFLGYMINNRMNSFRTIMSNTLYLFATNLVNLYVVSYILEKSPIDMFKLSFLEGSTDYFKSLNLDVSYISDSMINYFVGFYFLSALVLSFILYFVIRLLVKMIYKEKMESIKFFKIEGFSFLQFILFLIVITLFKTYDDKYGQIVFYSSVLSLTAIFAFQGFSSIYWFISSKLKNKYVSGIISLIFTFVFPGFLVSAFLGFFDALFDFRKV